MAVSQFVKINGSHLEGGGQILRMAMGFGALLKQPIEIHSIRGNRSKPGLKAQHLSGLLLVKDICQGDLEGAEMHSNTIRFTPGPIRPDLSSLKAETGTAGATTLLAQVSLPILLTAPTASRTILGGGTDADMAPPVEYYTQVFLPNLRRFGAQVEIEVVRRGYYPRGGGQIVLNIESPTKSFRAVELLERGEVTSVKVIASVAGSLPLKVAEEMGEGARRLLAKRLEVEVEVESRKETEATGNGSSIVVVALTSSGCILGGSAIGSAKQKPLDTGAAAAKDLLFSLESQACVDHWTQDQLIIYMALAKGTSKIRTGPNPITMHTQTAIFIAQKLSTAKFEVQKVSHCSSIITCHGIGFDQ